MAAKLFTAAWLPLLGLSILVVPTDGGFFLPTMFCVLRQRC
jgi:hypothetical protein